MASPRRVPNKSRYFVFKAVRDTWHYNVFPRKLTNGSAFVIVLNGVVRGLLKRQLDNCNQPMIERHVLPFWHDVY